MKTTRVTITIETEDDDGNAMEPLVMPYENFDQMRLSTNNHIEREYNPGEERWDYRPTGNVLTVLVIGKGCLDHWRGKPLFSDAIIDERAYLVPTVESTKLADWDWFGKRRGEKPA